MPNPAATIWALVIVAVVLAVVVGGTKVRRASRPGKQQNGGLVTGPDNRRSTGRIIAVAWTLIVSWMVVTEALIALTTSGTSLADLLSNASYLYFVFLGGPYAAAAFALLATQSKVAQGTVTKIPAASPSVLDVIADDNGNIDVYDFQYTLFNALAAVIVVVGFWRNPAGGLPDIPDFLAILAGGSALTYTVNKTIVSDGPQITSVTPASARVGDFIKIIGIQLFPNQAGGALPTVTIGGINASKVEIPQGSTNALVATVAGPAANLAPLSGSVDVIVTPPLASPIVLRNGITIVPDEPAISGVDNEILTSNGLVIVLGSSLLDPGTVPGTAVAGTATVGGLTVALQSAAGVNLTAAFEGAYSDESVSLRVGPPPAGFGSDAVGVELTFTRGSHNAAYKALRYQP